MEVRCESPIQVVLPVDYFNAVRNFAVRSSAGQYDCVHSYIYDSGGGRSVLQNAAVKNIF